MKSLWIEGGEEGFCMHVSWGWVAETELGRDLWRARYLHVGMAWHRGQAEEGSGSQRDNQVNGCIKDDCSQISQPRKMESDMKRKN